MLRPLFKRRLIFLASLFLVCMAILFFIAWWGRLPTNTGEPSTYQTAVVTKDHTKTVATDIPPDEPSSRFRQFGSAKMADGIAELVKTNPQKTGVYPLPDGMDAFAARMLLISTAEKTLDVQYYIWNNDITGNLMFQAIKEAAERGVRVRLLIDDNNTRGLDPTLWVLNEHPNIEVRVMNPNRFRSWRWLGFVGNFDRLNHRMHNKSLTADSQITITGGRNIGDEYFSLSQDMVFSDLDVLMVGQIVPQVSQAFDRYWNHKLAFPITDLVKKPEQSALNQVFIPKSQQENKPASQKLDPILKLKNDYLKRLVALDFVNQIKQQKLPLYWATTQLLTDNPDKLDGEANSQALDINQSLGKITRELNLVSAYFVPTERGKDYFINLAKQGVKVNILTNAMSATDVKLVHSGYAKYRKDLLKAGIKLYELKPNAIKDNLRDSYITGSSATSLHAKTFESDDEKVYVGSFNFDPRSTLTNTELGVAIAHPQLANKIRNEFLQALPKTSYTLSLNGDKIQWQTMENGKIVTYDEEPHTQAWQRTLVWMLSQLPIEKFL